jgi:hypothetical protein
MELHTFISSLTQVLRTLSFATRASVPIQICIDPPVLLIPTILSNILPFARSIPRSRIVVEVISRRIGNSLWVLPLRINSWRRSGSVSAKEFDPRFLGRIRGKHYLELGSVRGIPGGRTIHDSIGIVGFDTNDQGLGDTIGELLGNVLEIKGLLLNRTFDIAGIHSDHGTVRTVGPGNRIFVELSVGKHGK